MAMVAPPVRISGIVASTTSGVVDAGSVAGVAEGVGVEVAVAEAVAVRGDGKGEELDEDVGLAVC